jgi:exosome complex component CSL4
MALDVEEGVLVVPGTRLGPAGAGLAAGAGAYALDGVVYAALVGRVRCAKPRASPFAAPSPAGASSAAPGHSPAGSAAAPVAEEAMDEQGEQDELQDAEDADAAAHAAAAASSAELVVSVVGTGALRPRVVPVVGSIVTCRIGRINARMAQCEILCVGPKAVPGRAGFRGIIRKESVRSFEVDRVELPLCFRPGDIVRATVASLGTARSYELSTAEAHLGVVSAVSETGEPLEAVSHEQMRCPSTGQLEPRKVARLD